MHTDHHSIQLTLDQMKDSTGTNDISSNEVSLRLVFEENIPQMGNVDEFEEKIETDDLIGYKQQTKKNNFINRAMKKLKHCVNNSYNKRVLSTVFLISILALVYLLIVAFLLSLSTSQNIIKTNIIWYQNEIIYEIDVPMFRDSNQDGIGDLKGIIEKLEYLEKNNIQSILLQSSIFNVSDELFEIWNRQYGKIKTTDLLKLDPHIGSDDDFRDFMKVLASKNMHLIVDLPLSSSSDHKDLSWYGSDTSSSIKIEDPCLRNKNDLGCEYYKVYKRLPLDFSNKEICDTAESRLRYWLLEKNVDGVRPDLPLNYDHRTKTYHISRETINRWKIISKEIEKTTKPKLLLFDIPFDFQSMIQYQSFNEQLIHSTSLLKFMEKERSSDTKYSNEKNQASSPRFWQFGSDREYYRLGMMHDVSQRISLTVGMLIGGTPIVLYGDELGIKQGNGPWMPWTSNAPYGGFSTCLSEECNKALSSYNPDSLETNVEDQEAMNGINKEFLLIFFRRLSKLRKHESFQFGTLKKGYDSTSNILWFIREAPGHRGFIILIHLGRFKPETVHISLKNLTNQQVQNEIYYGYQSIKIRLSQSDSSSINSNKLLIYPGSINIFWWPPKVI